jgi:hypothetical protein
MAGLADAEIVRGSCINVQLRRHASSLQGQVHEHAMIRTANNVIASVCEKNWRRPGWNVQARRDFIFVLGFQVARINQDSEVGAAADLVDASIGSYVRFWKLVAVARRLGYEYPGRLSYGTDAAGRVPLRPRWTEGRPICGE